VLCCLLWSWAKYDKSWKELVGGASASGCTALQQRADPDPPYSVAVTRLRDGY